MGESLILTVKPQDMGGLLEEMAPHTPAHRLVVSAAAGITTAFIEERLAAGTPVVRVMSNTPVLVDEAMSAISAGAHAGEEHLRRDELIGDDPTAILRGITRDRQEDHLHELGTVVTWLGAVSVQGEYSFRLNESNSYGFSYVSHNLGLQVLRRLPWGMLAQVYGQIERGVA